MTYRVTLGGTVAGVGSWSIGLHLISDATTAPTPTQMATWAQSVYSLFLSTAWQPSSGTQLKALAAAGISLSQCRAYWYTGSSGSGSIVGVSTGSAVAGGGSSSSHPAQIAAVATLLTGISGRSYRGRAYLPLNAMPIDASTLKAPVATCNGAATSFANFLTALNGTSPQGDDVSVYVLGRTSGTATGAKVTGVRIDTVLDTQRRRRDKLVTDAVSVLPVTG